MKIAHLNLLPFRYTGIENKLIEQANAAKNSGLDIDYFILNNEKEYQKDNLIYKKFNYPSNKLVKKIMNRFFKFSLINNSVNLDKYDAIVLRYPRPVSYDWKKFTDRYAGKVVTEHHAIALPEIISKVTFGNILNYVQEIINNKRFKDNLIGLIGVTEEITREESKKNYHIQTQTISNGINVSEVTFTKFMPFDKKSFTMTIVASEYAPWHGLDKLLKALLEFETHLIITLNIVGEHISDEDKTLIKKINSSKNNVHVHTLGVKRGKELDAIFSSSTLAIGSLAIYRQKLKEACALKVREYLARGIPFVYSAGDPDVPNDASFALQIPNDDSPININEIIEFMEKVSTHKDISEEMRSFALKQVDWKIKVKMMYQFVQDIKHNIERNN